MLDKTCALCRQLFEATECGNGYVEVGEECDCGARMVSTSLRTISKHNVHRFWSVCTYFSLVVQECYKDCCKKCSLSNGAHCSDGPCCNSTCLVRRFTFASSWLDHWESYNALITCFCQYFSQFYPRGYSCRYAVNDCDISETCSGDSGQVSLLFLKKKKPTFFIFFKWCQLFKYDFRYIKHFQRWNV